MKAAGVLVAFVMAGNATREATLVATAIELTASGSLLLRYRIENGPEGAELTYEVPEGSAWPRRTVVQAQDGERFVTVRETPVRQCSTCATHRLVCGASVDAIEPVTGLGARTIRLGFEASPAVDGDRMLWTGPTRLADVTLATAGTTPLIRAAARGDLEALRELLEGGAAVGERDANGSTALHWAAAFGQVEACKVLLDAGAEVDARTNLEFTPAMMACRNNDLDVARLLHRHGADFGRCRIEARTAERRDGDSSVSDFLDEIGAR